MLHLKESQNIRLLDFTNNLCVVSSRVTASHARQVIVDKLEEVEKVTIDFKGVKPSQGFIDELIGVLVLKYSLRVITRLVFKNCTNEVKSMLVFVINDRDEQFRSISKEVK